MIWSKIQTETGTATNPCTWRPCAIRTFAGVNRSHAIGALSTLCVRTRAFSLLHQWDAFVDAQIALFSRVWSYAGFYIVWFPHLTSPATPWILCREAASYQNRLKHDVMRDGRVAIFSLQPRALFWQPDDKGATNAKVKISPFFFTVTVDYDQMGNIKCLQKRIRKTSDTGP